MLFRSGVDVQGKDGMWSDYLMGMGYYSGVLRKFETRERWWLTRLGIHSMPLNSILYNG